MRVWVLRDAARPWIADDTAPTVIMGHALTFMNAAVERLVDIIPYSIAELLTFMAVVLINAVKDRADLEEKVRRAKCLQVRGPVVVAWAEWAAHVAAERGLPMRVNAEAIAEYRALGPAPVVPDAIVRAAVATDDPTVARVLARTHEADRTGNAAVNAPMEAATVAQAVRAAAAAMEANAAPPGVQAATAPQGARGAAAATDLTAAGPDVTAYRPFVGIVAEPTHQQRHQGTAAAAAAGVQAATAPQGARGAAAATDPTAAGPGPSNGNGAGATDAGLAPGVPEEADDPEYISNPHMRGLDDSEIHVRDDEAVDRPMEDPEDHRSVHDRLRAGHVLVSAAGGPGTAPANEFSPSFFNLSHLGVFPYGDDGQRPLGVSVTRNVMHLCNRVPRSQFGGNAAFVLHAADVLRRHESLSMTKLMASISPDILHGARSFPEEVIRALSVVGQQPLGSAKYRAAMDAAGPDGARLARSVSRCTAGQDLTQAFYRRQQSDMRAAAQTVAPANCFPNINPAAAYSSVSFVACGKLVEYEPETGQPSAAVAAQVDRWRMVAGMPGLYGELCRVATPIPGKEDECPDVYMTSVDGVRMYLRDLARKGTSCWFLGLEACTGWERDLVARWKLDKYAHWVTNMRDPAHGMDNKFVEIVSSEDQGQFQ
ncbi:hypothetical protein GPECTOR_14g22 [Gonium pectorale]|uniref:Uncharacterized protein n=1 Tax=Gonium pectorale TaxID=33097 RepID=A0A150GMG0_GONPE|nr:hypothetical protein GPECTOR_14g22 [Gonium pectorale]|eukprot:KXZ50977.1 hypothetical protein GPECTOR_14g22 [Gonium pectorale]